MEQSRDRLVAPMTLGSIALVTALAAHGLAMRFEADGRPVGQRD